MRATWEFMWKGKLISTGFAEGEHLKDCEMSWLQAARSQTLRHRLPCQCWPWSAAEAEQPEDWDEDEDGEWEPPKVPNPACEAAPGCGEWKRPLTPNPEYKGKWSAPFIDNPLYKVGVGLDCFLVPVVGVCQKCAVLGCVQSSLHH